jgi:hypothetical protein
VRDGGPEVEALPPDPDPEHDDNAARAVREILEHRLRKNSNKRAIPKKDTTYDWKQGSFNCRTMTDRRTTRGRIYFWTGPSLNLTKVMHDTARSRPAAYLLACCQPEDVALNVWALPEPLTVRQPVASRSGKNAKKVRH